MTSELPNNELGTPVVMGDATGCANFQKLMAAVDRVLLANMIEEFRKRPDDEDTNGR